MPSLLDLDLLRNGGGGILGFLPRPVTAEDTGALPAWLQQTVAGLQNGPSMLQSFPPPSLTAAPTQPTTLPVVTSAIPQGDSPRVPAPVSTTAEPARPGTVQGPSIGERINDFLGNNSATLMALGGGIARHGVGGFADAAPVALAERKFREEELKKAQLQASLGSLGVPRPIAAMTAGAGSTELLKNVIDKYGKTDKFRPATPQEKAAAGVDANAPLFINDFTGEPKFGPPSTNVTLNADKSGAEQLAQETIKSYKAAQESGLEAQKRIGTLDTMAKAAEGFQPGALAQVRTDAKKYLRDLGFKVGEDVPDAQIFDQLSTQLQLHAAPKGQGAVSNYERTLYSKAVPLMTQDPAGLRASIEIAKRLDQYDMQVAKIYRDSAAKDKNGVPNYLEVQNEIAKLGPPLRPEDYAMIKQYSAAGKPTGTPPPAQPTTARPAGALKPGTYNWTPDGGLVPAR